METEIITNKIYLLKLFNGEMIIGTITDENKGWTIENPRSIIMMPSMTGTIQLAITSVCSPFNVDRLKKQIIIPFANVFFMLSEDEIDNELITNYKSDISGIKLATNADINSLNDKNEFII